MIETPFIRETSETSRVSLPPDFSVHLERIRALMQSPVHGNLDRWQKTNHILGPDIGGGD